MGKTILQRVQEKYLKDDISGCWVWFGALTRKSTKYPYGHLKINGNMVLSHRYMYEISKGIIPEGMHIDHLCRNTKCCNPEHLEIVTSRENTIRGANAKTHCKNGHLWIKENHYFDKHGHRLCKICSSTRCKIQRDKRSRAN